MNSKNIFYVLTCISFCTIIGAGIYEHIAVWPRAFSEPPQSLTMFQGNYAIRPAPFWAIVHPITLVLFFITLSLNWKSGMKNYILIPLLTYIVMLVFTFVYFVPELKSIIGMPFTTTIDTNIQNRGSLWITLSLARMTFIVISAFILFLGLTKADKR
ncbi:MAG: hypothetical protein LC117_10725 [Bacteroidia bacterium]|nr:hypothetical protein [Bacteroidia bacterium]MCZ2278389.1 hypothetical protein [Bacteroidia bacterium]